MRARMKLLAGCLAAGLAASLLPAGAAFAEDGENYLHAGTNIRDTESLQRGARAFMNYCSGCHSLKYLRYNRMAKDLQIPEPELAKLMFTTANPYDPVVSSMPPASR